MTISLAKTKFITAYACYRAFNLGNPYLQSDFISWLNQSGDGDITAFQSIDNCIVSHNGTLTVKDLRHFNRGFVTMGEFKSDKLQKPANIYPCIVKASILHADHRVPFEAMTVGSMHKSANRVLVTSLVEDLCKWISLNPEQSENDILGMFDVIEAQNMPSSDRMIQGMLYDDAVNDVHLKWRSNKRYIIEPTEDLVKEREESGEWGAW